MTMAKMILNMNTELMMVEIIALVIVRTTIILG